MKDLASAVLLRSAAPLYKDERLSLPHSNVVPAKLLFISTATKAEKFTPKITITSNSSWVKFDQNFASIPALHFCNKAKLQDALE